MSWPPFVLVTLFFMTWKLAVPSSHWSPEGAAVRALGQAGQWDWGLNAHRTPVPPVALGT